MKKNIFFTFVASLISTATFAQRRFPKPDFESGYVYPEQQHFVIPNEVLWSYLDIAILILLMSFVAWAVIKRGVRRPVIAVSLFSVAYFGFFRKGCVCSIGAVQNVTLALVDSHYSISLLALLFFILPIVFTLLFGRVFCAGVCPMGALQELVNIKNFRLSKTVTTVLELIPWIYLTLAVLFAETNSAFIICRFDPFVGIFRLGGDMPLIMFGVALLVLSIFTGRPFCRFICPYGALLSLFARVSVWKMKMTKQDCINCELCHNACPVDAIRPPYENKVKENRSAGVKRILIYILILPVMMALGGWTMRMLSGPMSQVHKEVRLYQMVLENEERPQEILSLELEAFYGQERTVEELAGQVTDIKKQFQRYATIAGVFLGIVFGFTLIGLSIKRTRRQYDINDARCVNCARCFSYCPQNELISPNCPKSILG